MKAQPAATAMAQAADGLQIDVQSFDLENGLHVIMHRDAHLPIVAINLWYHVGSKNERPGRTGFAHLFEHMMFQGSAHVPVNGHFRHIQEAGGVLNGSTSFDRTNYHETLPAHQLALGLWLEADRMRSLDLSPQTLETQRSVVMEERRSRYDNQPYGRMFEELFARTWTIEPYRWPTIGSMDDIRAATLEDVRDFHAMYYRPSNASLCIAGDIDPADVEQLVRMLFADIPDDGSEPYRPVERDPRRTAQVRAVMHDAVPLPAVAIAMQIPDQNDPEFPIFDVLSHILSSGTSSRLHQAIVEKARAAQNVITIALGMELPGAFVFRATAQPGASADRIEELYWEELERLQTGGCTPHELERAKNRMEASFIRNLGSMQSRADMLNAYHVLTGDVMNIHREMDLVRGVTAGDVQRAAAARLTREQSTVLHCLPQPLEGA